jgi:hypothetical protein
MRRRCAPTLLATGPSAPPGSWHGWYTSGGSVAGGGKSRAEVFASEAAWAAAQAFPHAEHRAPPPSTNDVDGMFVCHRACGGTTRLQAISGFGRFLARGSVGEANTTRALNR